MKHVFKLGGQRKAQCGTEYEIDVVNDEAFSDRLNNGWFASLEEAKASKAPEQGSDYEAELRAKIKALGGKAAGRSSIETLENQLKELEAAQDGNNKG